MRYKISYYYTDRKENVSNVHGKAILGNLSYPTYDNFKGFLSHVGSIFDNVYFIAGNCEYHSKYNFLKDFINEQNVIINKSINYAKHLSNNQNIFYLNNKTVCIDRNKYIIVSTLWSDHSLYLKRYSPIFTNNFYQFITKKHYDELSFIENELESIFLKKNM